VACGLSNSQHLYKYSSGKLSKFTKDMQDFIVTPAEYLEGIVFDFAQIIEHQVSDTAPPAEFLFHKEFQDGSDSLFDSPLFSTLPSPFDMPISPPPSPMEKKKRVKQPKTSIYECHQCPKVFSRAYALTSHATTHTTIQPYSCFHCAQVGKETRFKRCWDWKRHEKKCSNQKRRRGTF
jgi:hypothetical protein